MDWEGSHLEGHGFDLMKRTLEKIKDDGNAPDSVFVLVVDFDEVTDFDLILILMLDLGTSDHRIGLSTDADSRTATGAGRA
ncbi:hypothetical protein E4U42_006076 [Claviceps africana]|uniref:Uncharacterized protein n=1 Tax=Claviceps africana TaxID=83212 RepID=A0A8K0J5N8_9HYPO|nr:hypothetical protein E4U42_006076 [Claviceps africana]